MAIGIKTGGRTKGTPNKTTAEIRGLIRDFVLREWPVVIAEFTALEGKEKLAAFEKLLSYAVPKPPPDPEPEEPKVTESQLIREFLSRIPTDELLAAVEALQAEKNQVN